MSNAVEIALPKLPPLTLGRFDSDNFHDWVHTAQRFFVQYKLWDILTGETPNPAGDVEPSVTSGKIDLGPNVEPHDDGTIHRFLKGDPETPYEVSVFKWNEKHNLAYNYLLDSVKYDRAAYSRIVGCKTAPDAWQQLVTQYGARSDAKLGMLEEQLYQLKKGAETSMSKHIDTYSGLIEQIQFHLPSTKRWNDGSINRRFLRTLNMSEWLPWIRATGDRIETMTPAQLYAEILIDDEVLYGRQPDSKEANLANRIGGNSANGGGSSKRNKRTNKGKNNRFQPYDGHTYDGKRPDANYVKSMKEKWGSDYRECKFCTWPGHLVNDCKKLKELKSKGSKRSTGQKSSGNAHANSNQENTSAGQFIGWETSITELVASTTTINGEHIWGLDSHANVHITANRNRFVTYRQLENPEIVRGWQGGVDTVVGIGSIDLHGQQGQYRLHNVYYAPKARKQLLSEAKLLIIDDLIRVYGQDVRQTRKFTLKSGDSKFTLDGKIVDDLYYVFEAESRYQSNATTRSMTVQDRGAVESDGDGESENENFNVAPSSQPIRRPDFRHLTLSSTSTNQSSDDSASEIPQSPEPNEAQNDTSIDDATLWHNRLIHRAIATLQKAGIVSESAQIRRHRRPCRACIQGKHKKLPYRRYDHNTPRTLWRVHSDMSGMSVPSIKTNFRYFTCFVDDKSRYAWIHFTDRKDAKSIHDVFEIWRADAENKSGNTVSFLQTDEGGEYESVMGKLLERTGVTHLTSPPYSHQSNGLAERFNLTLKDAARTMMIHANLPQSFWAKAMLVATEIYNMLPHSATGKAPYEEFWKLPVPSLDRYKVFGCIIETHVPKETRPPLSMWDKRANRCVYVGTDSRSGYEYWDIQNNRFNHTHNCTFFENEFPTSDDFPTDPTGFQRPKRKSARVIPPTSNVTQESLSETQSEIQFSEPSDQQPILDTIVVQRGPPEHESNATQLPVNDKPSFDEALAGCDAPVWRIAMLDELRSIDENGVWKMHHLPPNQRPLGCRWVLTIKRDAQGKIERHKARLVVQGFGQQFGINYDETYAPVIRIDNVRLLFAIGAYYRSHGVVLWHIDFNNAFQNGELADHCIFIRQPPGFRHPQFPDHVLLLLKSLYGLKQASRIWFIVLCQLILDLGFTECKTDPCTFYSSERRIIIAVYVDDLLMIGKPEDNELCVAELSKRFKLRNHGPVKSFLGLNVEYANDAIHLNQIGYIHRKAQEFKLTDSKPYDTPLDHSLPLMPAKSDDKLCDETSYRELTGSLNHLAITSRPDIAFAVSKACQFNSQPTFTHLKVAKRILRYAIHTRHFALKYNFGVHGNVLIGYADADYASNLIDRKSTTGYIFLFNGGIISYSSRKQPTVATSTMESEYMALSDAIRELLSRLYYITELGISTIQPTTVFCDNQAAIALSDGQGDYRRAKHIDVRYHFIRDHLHRRTLEVIFIPSEQQFADFLTKALPTSKHYASIHGLHLD
jgi:transposase InsO family protein